MRAVQRGDRAIGLLDELLSSRKLQRSTRRKLLEVRRELIEHEAECDKRGRHAVTNTLQWAAILVKLYEALKDLID